MDPVTVVAIVVAVLLVAGVGFFLWQRQRSKELATRYGPEYSRTVNEYGGRRKAEAELIKRQERVEQLDIQPLHADQRERFARDWRNVQARFVDDPQGAISEADELVEEVMKAKGYPISSFEQRLNDLSVYHPQVLDSYRAAGEIAQRHRRGEAGTEDLRQALVHYRGLFEDLLADRESAGREAERSVNRSVERDNERVASAADRPPGRRDRGDREVRP